MTGYWFLDTSDDSPSKEWKAPEQLLTFISNARKANKKLVYIGFGSIVVSDPEALTKLVSEAVEKSEVCAIVSKGWSARTSSEDDAKDVKDAQKEQEKHERDLMSDAIYTVDVSQPPCNPASGSECAIPVNTARLALRAYRCSLPSWRIRHNRRQSQR